MLRKRMNKKGFTLVEIIVVLVILAILAAILIPSMVKWIDKAEEKSAIVVGRTMLLATQTIASEKYASGTKTSTTFGADNKAEIEALAAVDGAAITSASVTDGQVTEMVCTYDGKTVTYSNREFSCVTNP